MKIDAFSEIPRNSFALRMSFIELPLSDLNEHLLQSREIFKQFKRDGVIAKAIPVQLWL